MAENTSSKHDAEVSSRKTGTGFEDTSKAAKDTKDTLLDVNTAAEKTKEAFTELAAAMGLLLGLAEVVAIIKEGTEGFYENEKAMRGVSSAAKAYGLEVDKTTKEVDEWASAMARLGGVADDLVIRAIGEQLNLTGDLEQAQHRVTLAMDYATEKGVAFGVGMQVVNDVIHGRTRSLIGMIPNIVRTTEAEAAQAIGTKYLEELTRKSTGATLDNAHAADQAKIRWQQFKEEIGSHVAPAITWLRDGFILAKDAVILMGKELVEWFSVMGKSVGAFAAFVKDVFTGGGSLTASWKKYKDEQIKIDVEHAAASRRIEDEATAHYVANQSKELEAHAAGAKGKLTVDVLHAKKSLVVENTLAKQIEQTWKSHAQTYIKNQQLMAAEGKKLAEQGMLNVAKMESIEAEAHAKRLDMAKEYQATKRRLAREEIAMQMEIANATIGLASDLFGASKETAIASAIMNTYEGATKALAQGGIYGAVLAAIVIAAGLAQVAKIESSEPAKGGLSTSGSGFDDPSNDAAARQGGRRWAGDMIREFTSGVSAGWADGMRGGANVTNNVDNSRRTTINASIQDPSNVESVKKLIRTIKMVDSNVLGQTSIAARTK